MSLAARIATLSCAALLVTAGSLAAAPANDNFANATALTSNQVSVVGSNVGATKELMEPSHAGNQGGSSVWWSWTAQQSGFLTVSTAGSVGDNNSQLDTLLAVYRGSSLATLIREAFNDDPDTSGTHTSRVEFFVAEGTTYYIAVDGFSLDAIHIATGTIQLSLSFAPLPPAPGWVLPDVTGQLVNSTNFQGKVVLLNFWATTCLPCIAETPDLIALHTKYTNDGFSVIGISVDAAVNSPPSSLVSAFLTDHQINYPVAMSRPGSGIETNYGGVGTLPATFVIDRDNRIVHVLVGSRTLSLFETLVKPLIYSNLRASAGLAGDNLRLSWPVTVATVGIEATDSLAPPDWQPIGFSSQIEGTNRVLSLPNPGTNRFYRLKVE